MPAQLQASVVAANKSAKICPFSFPQGEGSALSDFLATVNEEVPGAPGEPPRITDAASTVYELLTGEDY